MKKDTLLLFSLIALVGFLYYKNKKKATKDIVEKSNNTGGSIITHPLNIDTSNTDTTKVPVPDINIILPKP